MRAVEETADHWHDQFTSRELAYVYAEWFANAGGDDDRGRGHALGVPPMTDPQQANRGSRKFAEEDIGPDQALELLRGVPVGYVAARLSRRCIAMFAKDMRAGRWECRRFDPIQVARDGGVVDGLNRLMAVIVANVPVRMYVERGRKRDERRADGSMPFDWMLRPHRGQPDQPGTPPGDSP